MSLFITGLRLFKIFGLGLLLLALLGLQRLLAPSPTTAGDGYQPADSSRPQPAAPAPVVRLVRHRLLADELRGTSASAQPNLARKALPRSRWYQAPCGLACMFSPPPVASYARASIPR
jgi:hypothetical protein